MPDDETLIELGRKFLRDQEMARERSRRWRSNEQNKAKIRKYKKEYNHKNKAEIQEYQKKYQAIYYKARKEAKARGVTTRVVLAEWRAKDDI
ncbi:hypothetical protein [Marinivivus vitaminiproducens]|uniref:hypothetical protein n=1 Tax=Marinivivus vitaminiproducens TaxID=3035935 RepID=UPI0027A1A2F4|nr:hypothetical protein P4R82_13420 [Geminicoccaceae bacterium SCSIO 64248]